METKPTIEEFMTDFLRERTEALKRIQEMRKPYRKRFYDNECLWDSRRRAVEKSESEKVISVSPFGAETIVITTGTALNYRSRYHVKLLGETWLIQEVDTECSRCSLLGVSSECAECGGLGWLSSKSRLKWSAEYAAKLPGRTADDQAEEKRSRDPMVESFMADHFQERTVTLKREMEIYGKFATRFYGPEFDWTRWVPSVQWSEAERIVSITLTGSGAQVITRDFSILRMRYNLEGSGVDWLVKEVDAECLNCLKEGKSDDCFLCGGTIWERKIR